VKSFFAIKLSFGPGSLEKLSPNLQGKFSTIYLSPSKTGHAFPQLFGKNPLCRPINHDISGFVSLEWRQIKMVFYQLIENRWTKVRKMTDSVMQVVTASQDLHVHKPNHHRA
jgi:hypothetical protein